ncbi:MAG: amidohydrolase [Gammaproteobacteria bacterium]|nr:amidohydrolase [Gammaproteobacteria bacterium]
MKTILSGAAMALALSIFPPTAGAQLEPLTIYPAETVITMDPSLPRASAVAVSEGRIVAVGDVGNFDVWAAGREVNVDERFADKVIVPGLIDNHLHPFLASIVLNTVWITPQEWQVGDMRVPATRTHEGFVRRLEEELAANADPAAPLLSWGYHASWHGEVMRPELNEISLGKPIVLIQRSFHEIIMNTAALDWLGLNTDDIGVHPDIELGEGFFSESGVDVALERLVPYFFDPERLRAGLDALRDAVHAGGITTIGDMGVGGYLGLQQEAQTYQDYFGDSRTPFRMFMVASPGLMLTPPPKSDVDEFAEVSFPKVFSGRHVKFFADGGFFALNMRMKYPGYTDGHEGRWMMAPEALETAIRPYWNDGYQVHVHVNGDEGLDVVLDILDRMLQERPRFDHRFTLHHVGISTNEQLRRAAALGVVISAQPNYLWALGDKYAESGLGYDRASQMSRIGAMVRNGIPTSLHSDFTMAPASPLWLAWVAANRITADGTLMAPEERISVEEALRAVTIDAAFAMGLEDEIGSIVAGKKADFTILEADPFEVSATTLRDIEIWGTVFEGTVYPISSPAD